MMLSFELKTPAAGDTPDELEIYMDREGLDSLLAQLHFLKDGRIDHVHLMSESWGGTHLSDEPQSTNGIVMRHVKIMLA
jgi:hypothetical protein